MFVASDFGPIGNLVFVIIAIAAWILKAALEHKSRKRGTAGESGEGGAAARPAPRPRAATRRPDEVDVVYGRRPLPPPLQPKPPAAGQAAAPTPTVAAPSRVPAPPPRPAPAKRRKIAAFARAPLGSAASAELDDVHAPMWGGGRGGRRRAWRRLSIPAGQRPADVVRAGVLWSEVLGLPRGVSGPHQSPVVRRLRARR